MEIEYSLFQQQILDAINTYEVLIKCAIVLLAILVIDRLLREVWK